MNRRIRMPKYTDRRKFSRAANRTKKVNKSNGFQQGGIRL